MNGRVNGQQHMERMNMHFLPRSSSWMVAGGRFFLFVFLFEAVGFGGGARVPSPGRKYLFYSILFFLTLLFLKNPILSNYNLFYFNLILIVFYFVIKIYI